MQTFLVESYWPSAAGEPLADAGERIRVAATHLAEVGSPVRYLGAVHLPSDELVLWRFEAAHEAAVRAASELARVPFERIVPAVEA